MSFYFFIQRISKMKILSLMVESLKIIIFRDKNQIFMFDDEKQIPVKIL